MKKVCLKSMLVLVIALAVCAKSHGQGGPDLERNLRADMSALAKDIANTLKGLEQEEVLVSNFIGPPIVQGSSAGPAIAKMLVDALKNEGIRSDRTAKYAIRGEYRRIVGKDKRPKILIEGEYEDNEDGKRFGQFEKQISSTGEATVENIAVMFGVSASIPVDQPTKKREETISVSISTPTVHLRKNNTRISADRKSEYAVEILAFKGKIPENADTSKLKYEKRPIQNDQGFAFVKLNRGEAYAVRIINNSKFDAAASLTIDGLSMFAFSKKQFPHVIVRKGQQAEVYGWYTNNKNADYFKITAAAEGAAAELNLPQSSVGVINVTFRAAWQKGTLPPKDESLHLNGTRGPGDATGRGGKIVQNFKPWQGNWGVIRDVISIRYDR